MPSKAETEIPVTAVVEAVREKEKKENKPERAPYQADMCCILVEAKDTVDEDELIVIKDKDLVKYIGPLARAVDNSESNWEETAINVGPILIPFKKEHVLFMFDTVRKYEKPTSGTCVEIAYPETVDKDLDFLKAMMAVSQYCECDTLHEAIAYVAAKRLNNIEDIKVITDFLGFECNADQSILDATDGFVRVD